MQKAFYSLILDRRIGAYELPAGSIVIGAGNRSADNALARPMASALLNRLIHVHLRASRQSSTPDIPRPGWLWPEEEVERATFRVVLDTSGSMDRTLLGKALGAIASYAAARDVPAARVVFCDAAASDAGYLPVADIAGRVRVKGRGGTVLAGGPPAGGRRGLPRRRPDPRHHRRLLRPRPVRREHAFLVPDTARLPFTPRGPVFRLR